MSGRSDGPVLRVDLRGASPEAAELAVHNLTGGLRDHGARVLVVDRADAMVEHDVAYEAMWASRMVGSVLCVAVGPPVDRDAGLVIRATPLLNNQTAATLWVGDPEGVSWPAGTPAGSSEQTRPESSLHTLVDLLRLPAVFDRVIELADQFPNRTASPGHVVVAGQIGSAELAEAKRVAVREITRDPLPPGGAHGPEAEDDDSILGTATLTAPAARLRPGSPLATRFEESRAAVERAEAAVAGLTGRFGPRLVHRGPDVYGEVAGAGRAVRGLRHTLTELFTRVDGRSRLDVVRRDELRSAGVVTDEPPDADREAIAGRLRDRFTDRLERGYSLADLAAWLRGLADHVAPVGSAARVDELSAACPDSLVANLTHPPRFPGSDALPWTVIAAIAGGLLATLGPWGPLVAPVLVLVWAAAVGLGTLRAPRPTRAGLVRDIRAAVLGHLGVGAFGWLLGGITRLIGTPPMLVGLALEVGVAVGFAVLLRILWSQAISTWHKRIGLGRAPNAIGQLNQLLGTVALREWTLGEPRRFAADAALSASGALLETIEVLAEPVPPGPRVQVSAELRRLVIWDLAQLVGEALRPCWDRLHAGVVDDLPTGLRERLTGLLADYATHVEAYGIAEPVGERTESRAALVAALWQESVATGALPRDLPADRRMLQLCGPADLPLLDPTVERFRLVRFAPRAAQGAFGTDRGAAALTWTASGHLAGVLRLVPLRAGAVEQNWTTSVGDGMRDDH